VWQTSNTPDTYYSCSDLQIKAKAVAVATAKSAKPAKRTATPKASRSAEPGVVASPQEAADPAAANTPEQQREALLTPASQSEDDQVALGHQIIIAALIVIAGVSGWALFSRWRSRRG
jgi:chitin-binding protein